MTATGTDATWLAALAGALDQAVWAWDADSGRVLVTNPAFRRQYAALADPFGHGGEVLLAHVAAEDRERVRKARSRLPQHALDEEYLLAMPGGRIARVHEKAVPNLASGHVMHLLRDVSWQFDTSAQLRAEISRRTDAERDLDDVRQRLEALIASANDAVVTITEDSRIVDWNRAAERMFGWSRAEAVGQAITDLLVPPEQRAHHLAGIERYLADGSSRMFGRPMETHALHRDGRRFDVELSVWPVRTGGRHTFSSFIRDISRRKAAEKALADSEAKYRQVVENVSEGILVTSGGKIVYANPKALALTGFDESTAMSRPFLEFIHPEDRERVLGNHLKRLRGEPAEDRYQFRVITTAGEVRWVEISGVAFEWQGTAATLNFLSDVTKRREAEDEIRESLARERELSELKSRFVAVASHEFRTPLAAILSSIELLDDYGPRLSEADRREVVGLVKSAVGRMNGMVEQVLLTSRLEAGQFAFEPRPQPLPELLVQVVAELEQAQAHAERISLRCEGVDEPRLVDVRLVRHVLVNLLGNALKYSPTDKPIACTLTGDGEDVRLEVADEGIGIPAEDLPRLFERFHRGTNVGNVQGTGIGLHVVRDCVQLHGGDVAVDSAPGRGTVFRVRLKAPKAD